MCMHMHTCCNKELYDLSTPLKTRVLLLSNLLLLRSSQRYLSEKGTVFKNNVNKTNYLTKKFIWLRLKFWPSFYVRPKMFRNVEGTDGGLDEIGKEGHVDLDENRVWLTLYEDKNCMLYLFIGRLKNTLVKYSESLNV